MWLELSLKMYSGRRQAVRIIVINTERAGVYECLWCEKFQIAVYIHLHKRYGSAMLEP
jgi:hypothetical protein